MMPSAACGGHVAAPAVRLAGERINVNFPQHRVSVFASGEKVFPIRRVPAQCAAARPVSAPYWSSAARTYGG